MLEFNNSPELSVEVKSHSILEVISCSHAKSFTFVWENAPQPVAILPEEILTFSQANSPMLEEQVHKKANQNHQ
jgi:hypothetical protein